MIDSAAPMTKCSAPFKGWKLMLPVGSVTMHSEWARESLRSFPGTVKKLNV